MAAYAYLEPAQLGASRLFVPTLNPAAEHRELGRQVLDAMEGISAKMVLKDLT